MKRSVPIVMLAILILVMSFSFAAYGKDDYETPIIPVVSSSSVSGSSHSTPPPASSTTDPYETPLIPGSSNPPQPSSEPSGSGLLSLLQMAWSAVRLFFSWILGLFGGLGA